ncbi:MAG: class I SAM-dependent methyltransferase [Andreesenia angusta]|nr:class I SAM-dependent methyltransferase [Andreesenia angusta]
MGIYREFARYYDDLMYDIDYESWYKFLKQISIRPFNNVLELACGTGNITEYLAIDESVDKVAAIDISEEMLLEASDKLEKYSKVSLYKQDMRKLDMGISRYDTVLCTCDGLNYIIDEEDIKEIFRRVYELILENGQFIFDLNSYYKLKEIIGNNVFIDETEDIFYIWENYFDEEKEISEFYITFFNRIEDEKYKRFNEIHYERAYREDKIIEFLKEAGFNNISVYYDFKSDTDKDENSSKRIFFVCNK